MQLEAIYNNGKLEFRERVRFARQRFKVLIDVPDEEIEGLPTAQIVAESAETGENYGQNFHPDTIAALARLEDIKQTLFAMPDDQFPGLTEEQEERISAFRGREDR